MAPNVCVSFLYQLCCLLSYAYNGVLVKILLLIRSTVSNLHQPVVIAKENVQPLSIDMIWFVPVLACPRNCRWCFVPDNSTTTTTCFVCNDNYNFINAVSGSSTVDGKCYSKYHCSVVYSVLLGLIPHRSALTPSSLWILSVPPKKTRTSSHQ